MLRLTSSVNGQILTRGTSSNQVDYDDKPASSGKYACMDNFYLNTIVLQGKACITPQKQGLFGLLPITLVMYESGCP